MPRPTAPPTPRVPSALRALSLLALTALAALVVACGGGGRRDAGFPDGISPLEPNRAQPPDGGAGEPYPEQATTARGTAEGYAWAHLRGYVRAPLATTWAAMRDPEVSIDRREVDEWTVTPNVDPAYRYSYRVHNVVRDVIRLEFDTVWRHDLVDGTLEVPEIVAARFEKTEGADGIINLMVGSMVARRVRDDVTDVEFVEHLDAFTRGPEQAERTMRDYYDSIVARVHGRPLPTYP